MTRTAALAILVLLGGLLGASAVEAIDCNGLKITVSVAPFNVSPNTYVTAKVSAINLAAIPVTIAVYAGFLRADGDTIWFLKNDGTTVRGSLANPATWIPVADDVSLASPFMVPDTSAFTDRLPGNSTKYGGEYFFVAGVAKSGPPEVKDHICGVDAEPYSFYNP